MNKALLGAQLRERYHLVVGALAVVGLARLGFAIYTGGEFASSSQSFGLRMAAWAMLVPAFAALLGAELARTGEPSLAFVLARPVGRARIWRSRALADLLVLASVLAVFVLLAPMAQSEDLPLPLFAACVGLWVCAHGLSALAGAAGYSPLGAAAVGGTATYFLAAAAFFGFAYLGNFEIWLALQGVDTQKVGVPLAVLTVPIPLAMALAELVLLCAGLLGHMAAARVMARSPLAPEVRPLVTRFATRLAVVCVVGLVFQGGLMWLLLDGRIFS